ncbi:MAG TPA: ABC transporter substrate-binding protein [Acidimicrobiales bacterium]|nr:ABC transporter substrate-binding protein [Acidimicrobiales bacterium]
MNKTRVGRFVAVAAAALTLGSFAIPATTAVAGTTPPTQNIKPLTSVGKGEGALNLIAWEGYAQPEWVTPFEHQTGCQVSVKYAGSSSEMVSLMANGGGHQYDLVSASGDADLRLIYGGDVKPVNMSLLTNWKNFQPFLKAPPFNTINGVHYGISYEFGPNVLLYSTKTFKTAPTSWSVIYSSKYKGKVTIPDNPIQIADAALYLSKSKPSLGITDPYELTQPQFNAAVNLLKAEHPLIKKYWDLASQEIQLFTNGAAVVGAAWPYQTNTLKAAHVAVADTIPSEGATGWADTWLLATNAPHPNCAYKWMQWVTTPKVQAQEAIYFGETPANTLACPIMNTLQAGGCAAYHANAPASYFSTLKFWKTPLSTCDNGKNDCVDFTQWQQAWTQIIG